MTFDRFVRLLEVLGTASASVSERRKAAEMGFANSTLFLLRCCCCELEDCLLELSELLDTLRFVLELIADASTSAQFDAAQQICIVLVCFRLVSSFVFASCGLALSVLSMSGI